MVGEWGKMMKRMILTLVVLSALICGGEEISFNDPAMLSLNSGEKRDQTLTLSDSPAQNVSSLKLSWGERRHRFAELNWRGKQRIEPVQQAWAELTVFIPETVRVGRIGLRFSDKTGEIFQFYPTEGGLKREAWSTLSYRISEADVHDSWRGNADRKVDGTLRFRGIAVNFPSGSGSGEMWIGKLNLHQRQDTLVECREPFLKFDRSENFVLSGSPEDASLRLVDGGWEFFCISETAKKFSMTDRKFALTPYVPADRVILQLEAERCVGRGAVTLNYTDSTGKRFRSKCNYSAGQKTLEFKFPASKAPSGRYSSFTIEPEPGEFRLFFSGSERFLHRSEAEAIDFDIETGNPLHLLLEGEEEKLSFRFTNRAVVPLEFRAELELIDYYGRSLKRLWNLTAAPGEGVTVPFDGKLPAMGIWYVTCRISEKDGNDVAITKRSFAWMKPAGPTPGRAEGFLFGICSHPQRWSLGDQELEALAMAYCGAKVLRNDTGWGNIQPSPDRWNFESMDRKVELFGRYHIELAPIWAYTPRWAAAPEVRNREWRAWFRSLPDLKAWETYVATLTKRYRGKIRLWEIWNEPDFSGSTFNSDEYAEMMKIAWRAAKAVDPEVVIQSGGFATVKDHPSRKGNFHEEALVKGRGFFDIHAYHEHGRFPTFQAAVEERFLPMRERTGTTVPWYANETALSSLGGERGQALALFKKLIFSWANGAIGYNWYDLRNDGFDAKNNEHNYGMMTNDFQPKSVYVVYNTLAGTLSGAQYLKRIDCGTPELYVYLFSRNGELLAGIWNETARGAAVPLLFRTDADEAECVDLMGNRRTVAVRDGIVVSEAGRDPVILRLKHASQCGWTGNLVLLESGGSAVPGSDMELAVRVHNPYAQEREFRLTPIPPTGVKVVPAEHMKRIAPGKTARLVYRLPIPENYLETSNLLLDYAFLPDGAAGRISIPLVPARRIPSGEMASDKPDFRMDRRAQSVSLFEADPGKVHLTWQGPEDRSALVWLRREGETLRLRFDVTDDRHIQPNHGVGVWRGDNVQLALQLPDRAGMWEVGLTRLDSGENEVYIWSAPTGFSPAESAASVKLTTSRSGTLTRYEAELPLKAFGMTPEILAAGIRFNALVNDDDGEGREGWIQIAPGIGEDKDPAKYPLILLP